MTPLPPTHAGHTREWIPPFAALTVIWGLSFLFIKVSLEWLTPIGVSFTRCAIGAFTLTFIVLARKDVLPRSRTVWMHLLIVALLNNSLPWTLLAIGETHVTSVTAGMINAATPITTLIVLMMTKIERLTPLKVTGMIVAFCGVAVLLGIWNGLQGDAVGVGLCLASICCYGIAVPYTRRFLINTGYSSVSLASGQMMCASALLLPFAIAFTPWAAEPSWQSVVSIVLLGSLGSGVAFALNFRLIALAGPATASSVTYVAPIISTIAGALLLSEPLAWNQPLGGLLILLGVVISTMGSTLLRRWRPA